LAIIVRLKSYTTVLTSTKRVEDNEFDMKVNFFVMNKMNITKKITTAFNGREGVEYLIKNAMHNDKGLMTLILLDINMPGMNGFEFLEEISKFNQKTNMKVVMLSSSDDIKDMDKAMSLGASGYLVKPLKKEELSIIIEAF
jgi:YesN/AraC family two-component response regulator